MKKNLQDMIVLSLMGPLMFVLGDVLFEALPNVHLVGVLTVVLTAVYRRKALIAVYLYVALAGLFGGFSLWWVPYLYVWAVLWGAVMLVPRRLPKMGYLAVLVALCGLHSLLFGMLYAPAQAVMFRMYGDALLAWIWTGLVFDVIPAAVNLALAAVLVPPLYTVLTRLTQAKEV